MAEQPIDLQQRAQREIRNNTTRELHSYNNNGNTSESSLFSLQPHRLQRHHQARLTLRANLPQHNSKQGQHFWKQTPLQIQQQYLVKDRPKFDFSPSIRNSESALRRSNEAKNLESKKRVVKMLFVLVLEFFICWTPLYVINTIVMFIGPAIYEYIDYTSICFFQLLAYSSSCCNPITYCFMNAGFRRAFLDTFKGMHMSSGSSRRMSEAGFSGWVRRRKRVASGSNSVSCTQFNSISLTNNTIIVPNNSTAMHNSQNPQSN
ncbi:uncharacterized protein LOC105215416 [Zeugodacus cucurbitae]|uniref:uncharacterized protein LOC105215416 n=1 Tax=Zeugodacus cucurbitae TaxID=28588 RepID=UPI0010A74D55|nr:uncharacterized protein LOC105215416 [Zeugodacus cucurbitae]